jgi:hypothetical protein
LKHIKSHTFATNKLNVITNENTEPLTPQALRINDNLINNKTDVNVENVQIPRTNFHDALQYDVCLLVCKLYSKNFIPRNQVQYVLQDFRNCAISLY